MVTISTEGIQAKEGDRSPWYRAMSVKCKRWLHFLGRRIISDVSRNSYGTAKKVILDCSILPRPSPPVFLLATVPSNLAALICGHLLQFFLSSEALKPRLVLCYSLLPPPLHIVSGHLLWQWQWLRRCKDLLDLARIVCRQSVHHTKLIGHGTNNKDIKNNDVKKPKSPIKVRSRVLWRPSSNHGKHRNKQNTIENAKVENESKYQGFIEEDSQALTNPLRSSTVGKKHPIHRNSLVAGQHSNGGQHPILQY